MPPFCGQVWHTDEDKQVVPMNGIMLDKQLQIRVGGMSDEAESKEYNKTCAGSYHGCGDVFSVFFGGGAVCPRGGGSLYNRSQTTA